jgi:hypothetical protein
MNTENLEFKSLFGLDKYINDTNRWLAGLSTVESHVKDIPSLLRQLKSNMSESGLTKIHDTVKDIIKEISTQDVKEYLQVLILQPIQKWLGRIPMSIVDPRRTAMIGAVNQMKDPNIPNNDRIKLLRDGLTKGAYTNQLNPHSPTIHTALDNIIIKLAALNQPLGIRPDYGTTGDMAERLKQVKKQLRESVMFKTIPMMDYDDATPPERPETEGVVDYDDEDSEEHQEQPVKVVVIDDYDDDSENQVVKQGPPCCTECGQEIPAVIGKNAGDMNHKIKKMRDILTAKELKEGQVKELRRALEAVYLEYNRREQDC